MYLSGAVKRADNPSEWRDELKEEFQNIEFADPLEYGLDPQEDGYELVWKQLRDIMCCDFLLHNYRKGIETYGTPIEMAWAFMHGTPVVTWSIHDLEEMPLYAVVFSDVIGDDVGTLVGKGWKYTQY